MAEGSGAGSGGGLTQHTASPSFFFKSPINVMAELNAALLNAPVSFILT